MNVNMYRFTDTARLDEFRRVFAAGLGETTQEHWMWRLFTPNGAIQPEAFVAENEHGEILAVSSVLPQIYGRGEYTCAQLCDWAVRPDCRGQGLIGKLYRFEYEYYENRGFDFMMGFPNENSYPILIKYGFEERKDAETWCTAKHLLRLPGQPELNGREEIHKGVRYCFSKSCGIPAFRQRADKLYRTPEFMHWKYDLNPDADYTWLTVYRGETLLGYLVYTLTRGRIRTAVNIYDWDFTPDEYDAFSAAIGLLKKQGNYVSIWGSYAEWEAALLEKAGLRQGGAGARPVMKPISKKGCPASLVLTRLDTDY